MKFKIDSTEHGHIGLNLLEDHTLCIVIGY